MAMMVIDAVRRRRRPDGHREEGQARARRLYQKGVGSLVVSSGICLRTGQVVVEQLDQSKASLGRILFHSAMYE